MLFKTISKFVKMISLYILIFFLGSISTLSSSSDYKELKCGGLACQKCGACRDWYQRRNSHAMIKRNDATCNCNYIFSHQLVPHPEQTQHSYYPRQVICTCRDNY